MSVYTSLSLVQVKQLLAAYELQDIIGFEGISDGIENTNYRVKTASGHYVLTIFEHYKSNELPYFLHLMAFLRSHNMAVPGVIVDSKQQMLTSWQEKPAALFKLLPGQSIRHPELKHCQQIGTVLAHLHIIGQQFPLHRNNDRGHLWAQKTASILLDDPAIAQLDQDDSQLLSDELLFQQQFQQENSAQALPRGIIHADLFRDNVLFENGWLSGILDFYTACHDSLLFDLAVTVNDWCLGEDHYLDLNKARALITAYTQFRPLNKKEQQHWSTMLRAASLRFWLSRLLYRQSHKAAQLAADKDPGVLKCLLLKHRENITFCRSLLENHIIYTRAQP